ncbi:MAG: hypothetical protein KF901_05155 [Myxococcales bacterium]|nr:hypothetical protein [Myxococcales bacterium]
MLELPTLEVHGAPRALGRGQGEAFREKIREFVGMRLEAVRAYFAERGQGGAERLMDVGRESFAIYRAWDPDGFEEHVGIAEGANLDATELFTVANMTDMRDAVLLSAPRGEPLRKVVDEGCTSVLLPGSHTKSAQPLVGQTWDLNPPDVDFVIGVHRRPAEGPETWGVTCVGCLTLMGMNEHGLVVGTTNIKTFGSRPGVGYLCILHRAVRARDVEEATALVQGAPHAGAHTYWLADEVRQLEWEASPNGAFLREVAPERPLWRTNHCLAPAHRALEGEVPGESSRKRFESVARLVDERGFDELRLRALFADRSEGVLSVNRYAEDGQGTATNAVFIASPSERRAWACRGPADRGAWVELRFERG